MNVLVNKFNIISALQTEKSSNDVAGRKYHFLVTKQATKSNIASDIKKIYAVEVVSVNIVKGSTPNHKKHSYLQNKKKCIVTLKENQAINF